MTEYKVRHCAPNKQQIHSSCSVFRGSLRKLSAYLFTGVLELFQKRKCLNFHEMRSNKTQSSRRGLKCTLRIRNWLRPVANRKTRIFLLPRRHLLRQDGSRKIYALKYTYQLHSMASTFRMRTPIFHGFQQTENHLFTVELALKGVFRTCLGSKGSMIRGRCLWMYLCRMPFLDSWIWRVYLSFFYFLNLISYK